jgi:hypothetical protein
LLEYVPNTLYILLTLYLCMSQRATKGKVAFYDINRVTSNVN